jgi:hypothetical protein
MSKYTLTALLTFFLIFISIVADSVLYATTVDMTSGVPASAGFTVASMFGFVGTFFKILTFQITGFPVILTLLIFYPLTFMVIMMLVSTLKGLIPFTSGGD